MGRVDECTNGANGLRDNGSLDGKVGELGKMKEAFVVKCQGTQESPANLLKSCKRVPQGCLTGERVLNGCEREPNGYQNEPRALPPLLVEKYGRQCCGKSAFWLCRTIIW